MKNLNKTVPEEQRSDYMKIEWRVAIIFFIFVINLFITIGGLQAFINGSLFGFLLSQYLIIYKKYEDLKKK